MNKRINLGVMCVTLFTIASAADAFSGSGAGTVGDPYQITTCVQLQEIADERDAHYRLENHIDCTASATWNAGLGFNPVGDDISPFTGSLDGQNFEIRNLFIERANDLITQDPEDEQYVGIIGYASNATLENIRLIDVYVKGHRYVGGLVGYAVNTTMDNIRVNTNVVHIGTVIGTPDRCDPIACIWARWGIDGGGVVGYAETSTITDVIVGGAVKGSGINIGGVVGTTLNTTISNATSTAFVDGGENIGGIIGLMQQGSLTRAVASGEVEGQGDDGKPSDHIGGLVGNAEQNAEITHATATGVVSGRNYVGGLIGRGYEISVSYAVAIGNVTATAPGNTSGGFIGSVTDSVIATSSARGDVTAQGDVAGGFAGRVDDTTIRNSYATGDVEALSSVGGFAGSISPGTIIDSYATGDVEGTDTVGGFSGGSGCESTFLRSYATGNVTATDYSVGGFTGSDGCEGPGSTMNQVYATGNVTSLGDSVGGFVGSGGGMTITDAYASGNVSGADRVGGFAGNFNTSVLTNAYARGDVTGTGVVGGLVADGSDNTLISTFWDTETSGQAASVGGTGRATTQMKSLANYTDANWDFATIWGINSAENSGYPFFRFSGLVHVAPASPVTRRSGGGGTSVVRKVAALEREGEVDRAAALRAQFPSLFSPIASNVASNEQLVRLQSELMRLLQMYRTLTGRDFSPAVNGQPASIVATSSLVVRDLYRGLSGDDVRALQVLLINHNAGPKAQELKRVTATGDFINYTEEALIEYQLKYGITPATGYFGPATRAQMKAVGLSGIWW